MNVCWTDFGQTNTNQIKMHFGLTTFYIWMQILCSKQWDRGAMSFIQKYWTDNRYCAWLWILWPTVTDINLATYIVHATLKSMASVRDNIKLSTSVVHATRLHGCCVTDIVLISMLCMPAVTDLKLATYIVHATELHVCYHRYEIDNLYWACKLTSWLLSHI